MIGKHESYLTHATHDLKLQEKDFNSQMKQIMTVLLRPRGYKPPIRGSLRPRGYKPPVTHTGGCRKLPVKYLCGCLVMTKQIPKSGPCAGDTEKNTDVGTKNERQNFGHPPPKHPPAPRVHKLQPQVGDDDLSK